MTGASSCRMQNWRGLLRWSVTDDRTVSSLRKGLFPPHIETVHSKGAVNILVNNERTRKQGNEEGARGARERWLSGKLLNEDLSSIPNTCILKKKKNWAW